METGDRLSNPTRLESGGKVEENAMERVSDDILSDIEKERNAIEKDTDGTDKLSRVNKLITRLDVQRSTSGATFKDRYPEIYARQEEEYSKLLKLKEGLGQ